MKTKKKYFTFIWIQIWAVGGGKEGVSVHPVGQSFENLSFKTIKKFPNKFHLHFYVSSSAIFTGYKHIHMHHLLLSKPLKPTSFCSYHILPMVDASQSHLHQMKWFFMHHTWYTNECFTNVYCKKEKSVEVVLRGGMMEDRFTSPFTSAAFLL